MKRLTIVLICVFLGACNLETHVPPIELVDPSYVERSRNVLTSLCKGDIDQFIAPYTENATYRWNYGDSLVGRQAIIDYWTARRNAVIDTITYKNESWLAIRANNPPEHIRPGVYVLSWADFTITYTNGSTIDMNIHTVFGYDTNDKIVTTIQYLDRSLIETALKPAEKLN